MGTNQKSINRGWRDGSIVKALAALAEEGILLPAPIWVCLHGWTNMHVDS